MVAPVVAGLSRVIVAFARSPAGKQFLKTLKKAGKSPEERKILLSEQVKKSYRDNPGVRERLIALEQGQLKEKTRAQTLEEKIAARKKLSARTKKEKKESFQPFGGVPLSQRYQGVGKDKLWADNMADNLSTSVKAKQLKGRNKDYLDKIKAKLEDPDLPALTPGELRFATKYADKGKLDFTPPPVGVAVQKDMFEEVRDVTYKDVNRKTRAASTTRNITAFDKEALALNLEKVEARIATVKNEISSKISNPGLARLKLNKLETTKHNLLAKINQEDLFTAAGTVGVKRAVKEKARLKEIVEISKKRELRKAELEEGQRLLAKEEARKDAKMSLGHGLPKDVHRETYDPRKYGFKNYDPEYRGLRTREVGPPGAREIRPVHTGGLPEFTAPAPAPAPAPIANIPKAQGAAPAFAKELTGRQTRRSMGAITPGDDILAGVPYKLNPTGELKYAYPKTGDIKTSTFVKKTEWDLASGKIRDIPKGSPEYGQTEIAWAGRPGNPHNRVNSRTGLTVDEFDSLSDAQKNELNRRLQLAKAGGAKVSTPKTGYKIPPELTQTGMTQAEYAGVKDQLKPGGMGQWQLAKQLDRADKRIAGQAPAAGRHAETGSKTILADGTEMYTADFRKLPGIERLGMLDKSFATVSPKGQGVKSLPNKLVGPQQPSKSYHGMTKEQFIKQNKEQVDKFLKKALKLDEKTYNSLTPSEADAVYTLVRYKASGPKTRKEIIDAYRGARKIEQTKPGIGAEILDMIRSSKGWNSIHNAIGANPGLGLYLPRKRFAGGGSVDKNWIQKVRSRIKKKGTEGVCTGEKYGSSSCPPGSKRYNLAKTFRSMNRKRA